MLLGEYPHIPRWSGGRNSSLPTLSLPYGAPRGGKRQLAPSVVERNEPVRSATFSRDDGGVR